MSPEAEASGTAALLCAGAFPGFSNVLAMEAAAALGAPVEDLAFNYFTAGLGGSGTVNLDITNYGFGPPVARYVDGAPAKTEDYAGADLGEVEYFFPGGDGGFAAACWAWPFPEAATVAEELGISGTSRAGMGTRAEWRWVSIGPGVSRPSRGRHQYSNAAKISRNRFRLAGPNQAQVPPPRYGTSYCGRWSP